jgi:ferredoxin-NADP reductase
MRPKIYEELIRVLRSDDKNVAKLLSLIESEDKNNMMFVVKDYNSTTGVSHKLHNEQDSDYAVKGPFGRRLGVNQTGLYFCFAAGTGVLPFMDLVA